MRLCVVIVLAAASAGAEDLLETERPSPTERRRREEAVELWKKTEDVREALMRGKAEAASPERRREALGQIEEVVRDLERSLRREWNNAANDLLAQAVKAWFQLRAALPPEKAPEDPEEKEQWERRAARARRERVRDARKFVLDVYRARRHRSLFDRCGRCDGRGERRDPFGKAAPQTCGVCGGQGRRLDKKHVLECEWFAHSPLYRARGRNQSQVNRLGDLAVRRPEKLGPFVQSVSVDGEPEVHDAWIRFTLETRRSADPDRRARERTKETVVVYRVGEVWYLYDKRVDGAVLDIEPKDGR